MSNDRAIVESKPDTSLVLSREHIGSVMANIDMLTQGFREWLNEDVDYTKTLFGRSGKPSLLDTGTAKLMNFFQVRPRHRVLEHLRNVTKGEELIKYVVAAELVSPKTGWVVAEGGGSCSTDETKYQYRWFWSTKLKEMGVTEEERVGLPTRIRNNAPQWRIRNREILDLDNTMLKMALKRAEMDAVLQLPGVSAVFTQDLGDESSPVRKHVESERRQVPSEAKVVGDGIDFKAELEGRGFDVSRLEFVDKDVGWRVNAVEWLGDDWAPLNNAIRELGGEWIRNEENKKENHWWIPKARGERTPVKAPPPPEADPSEPEPEEEPDPDIIPGSTPLGDFSKPQEDKGATSLDEIMYFFEDKIPGFDKLMNVVETADGFMIDQARLLDDEINVKVNSMVLQMGGEHLKRGGPYGLGWFVPKKG